MLSNQPSPNGWLGLCVVLHIWQLVISNYHLVLSSSIGTLLLELGLVMWKASGLGTLLCGPAILYIPLQVVSLLGIM